MIYKLPNRNAVVNDYLHLAIENLRASCTSCILNGTSEISKELYALIAEKGIQDRPCSEFPKTLEDLGYKVNQTAAGGCATRQHQALALYLLLSKPKEKRK